MAIATPGRSASTASAPSACGWGGPTARPWPGLPGERELSGRPEAPDSIAIKISGGSPPLSVLVNGMPLDVRHNARTLFFEPDGPGFVRLTVTDATGAADSVVVRLQ